MNFYSSDGSISCALCARFPRQSPAFLVNVRTLKRRQNAHMRVRAVRRSVRRGRWLERSPIRQSITRGDLTWTWKQVLGIRFSILHTTLINAVRLLHRSLSLSLPVSSSSFVRLLLELRKAVTSFSNSPLELD